MDYTYRELDASDTHLLQKLMVVFAKAFEDTSTYQKAPAGEKYLLDLLSKPHFITLVAIHNNNVVGGLVAYELEKFEQERSEIYIYDLAVDEDHRRKGLATHLIGELRNIAKRRGAYVSMSKQITGTSLQ